MLKKHLGLIIAFGPEVRSFIYSGLLGKIAAKHRITIFASRPHSAAFQGLPESVRVLPFPEEHEPPLLNTWRFRAAFLHTLWLEKLGNLKWQHYLDNSGPKTLKRYILSLLSNNLTVRGLSQIERFLAKHQGTNATWAQYYAGLGIDGVITSSYASERTLPALQTALNMGLKTIIMTNSWKDIHVKPHLPLQPTKILVWNNPNARLFVEFNPWMRKDILAVSGSLHLGPFINRANILPKKIFYHQTGLDAERPFICYTAAAPQAVIEEEQAVALMLAAIKDGRLPRNLQVLLRINPMEDGRRFNSLANQYPAELIMQRPQWEWFPELDWCCALEEDVKIWVSMVHYAAVNVSIPSTVTLEFASLGKPVVNVCFDASAGIPAASSSRRFWSADFYSEIKSMGIAVPSFSAEELITNLTCLLNGKDSLPGTELHNWVRLEAVDKVLAAVDGLWG